MPEIIDTTTDPHRAAWEAIRAAHGGSKRHQTLNRAIRAECPGGALLLDLLGSVHGMAREYGMETRHGTTTPLGSVLERLTEVADAMEADVRRRWGLPPALEREGLGRGGTRGGKGR